MPAALYNATVPIEFTRALLAQARAHHRDVGAILEEARFPFDPLRQDAQTAFVSREQYSRLCLALIRTLGDESGGVMPDVQTPVGTTRLLALSMIGCPVLEVAMRRAIQFNRFCRVHGAVTVTNELSVDEERREATLAYLCPKDPPASRHRVLCNLAIWLRFCAWLIGQQIDVVRADCAGPQPPFLAGVRHFFSCPVAYGQPVNAVTFSAQHLDAGIVRSEAQLGGFLKLAPYYLVIEPDEGVKTLTRRIREIIGDDFCAQLPGFEELAGLLNMSARTLRRRLEREGTSYQRIKDNARRDAAISLLSRDGLTVSAVAERVGFADTSAFHRSFRKWTGQSPGSYR